MTTDCRRLLAVETARNSMSARMRAPLLAPWGPSPYPGWERNFREYVRNYLTDVRHVIIYHNHLSGGDRVTGSDCE